jgi:hypothetical protein
MIQYRSALLVSPRPDSQMRFSTSRVQPTLEPVRTHFSSFDANATAAIAMFGRAWIHLSQPKNL